jgi:hypothetical protein
MKKLLLTLCIFSCIASYAQVSSSCAVPPLLETEYNKDIVQLTTARLFQIQSPDTAIVRVPQVHYDSIAGGLAAIFNATSIPERDSVFNLYCVHNHNGFPYDYAGLLVEVDTSYSWTNAWQSLNIVTGNSFIDNITSTYSLDIVNFYNWSFGSYAELSTDSAWNILALSDTFLLEPGVITADPNYWLGMAGTIEYNVIGNYRYYDFYFEFNDCFDGCDNYRKWMFRVDTNCTVEYLGFIDWGVFGPEPLPSPINCNVFTTVPVTNAGEDLHIFPNPVSDKINLHITSDKALLRIYNSLGTIILSKQIDTENSVIDFSQYSSGIYIAEIFSEGRTALKKFIKQ